MNPAALRRLADELEHKGRADLARQARNRAASRELGVGQIHRDLTSPFTMPYDIAPRPRDYRRLH